MITKFLKHLFSLCMTNAVPADWATFWGSLASSPQGAILASAATITPTHPVHFVSGTTQVDLITLPWAGFKGAIILIPTGAHAYTSGGTATATAKPIKVTYTGVANRPILVYCDGDFWYVMAIA